MRHTEIKQGTLVFPKQIMSLVNPDNCPLLKFDIEEFWNSLWHSFLNDKKISGIFWYDIFGKDTFNLLVYHLSKSNWIISSVMNDYATITLNKDKLLKWVTEEELLNIKYKYKLNHYVLSETKSTLNDVVKINNKHKKTGLIRSGFMKAGNHKFFYDTAYLSKYINEIGMNLKKGLAPSMKDITYQEIIDSLIQYYSVNTTPYTLGDCILDSRGRSIFQCTRKIFNPITSKDARALLTMPKAEQLSVEAFNDIYAFISELLDYRGKNYKDKVTYGQCMYICRVLPSFEEMQLNNDYDKLHNLIWLERIYHNLDTYENTGWNVLIEGDVLASMIQLLAVLTNDTVYMKKTNMIGKGDFQDIWSSNYISRTHIKKVVTPKLYGSRQSPKTLLDKNKLTYTQTQLNKIKKDISHGIYKNANTFKDFILDNVICQSKMTLHIRDEKFDIECNRFKLMYVTEKDYYIYTTYQDIIKKVTQSTNLIHDLNQFKTFMITALLHNLDSQIANTICLNLDYVLPNHDAFIISPNDLNKVREIYIQEIMDIYKNRHSILTNYFTSIGIEQVYKDVNTDVEIDKFNIYCIK